jgi:hypothetical protein
VGLKEQLREKAARAQERARSEEARAQAAERYFAEAILPAMQTATEYFEAVVNDLVTINQSISLMLPLGPPSSPGVSLSQSRYRFRVDDRDQPRSLAVTCTCELGSTVTRYFHDVRDADDYEQQLRDIGLDYFRRRQEPQTAEEVEISRFTVEGSCQAGFTLSADIDRQRINVELHNLEDRPIRSYVLTPERLTEDLCEVLAELLLRERSYFLKTELDDEIREQLRREVDARNREQERAVSLAAAERFAEQAQRTSNSVATGAAAAASKLLGTVKDLTDRSKRR